MKLIACTLVLAAVAGATTIEVTGSLGPNPWASPNFADYIDNATLALYLGLASEGSGPARYAAGTHFTFEDMTVTDYPSWRGQADPPPPYDQESGTSFFAGAHIIADEGATFHPSDVQVWQYSSIQGGDPWQWGPFYLSESSLAGMRGYLDGVEVAGLTLDSEIDELVYVGIAGAFDASTYWGFGSGQAGLDAAIAEYRAAYGPHSVTTCYDLNGTTNCDSIDVETPEPAGLALVAVGLLGLGLLRRRL